MRTRTILALCTAPPVAAALLLCAGCRHLPGPPARGLPVDNPVASFYGDVRAPAWTGDLPWDTVVSVSEFEGDADTRFRLAREAVARRGGGVIYFPAGIYTFTNDLVLADRCIIRGADPGPVADARQDDYAPPTRFEFPRYTPSFTGGGTPNGSAFKMIRLEKPESDGCCGVVNVAVNRAHVFLGEAHDPAAGRRHVCGRNRLVFGCRLTNTAYVDDAVPFAKFGQPAWQRFTARHRAAIHVHADENLLVANNRIPRSGDDSFTMPGAVIFKPANNMDTKDFHPDRHGVGEAVTLDVLFDFDNRPGIYANDYGDSGAAGDGLPNATPEACPWSFRHGIVIRDNYVFATGRTAISFNGDGVVCADNVIRIPDGIVRPTCKGYEVSDARSTNDNRAIRCRGYRWEVTGNDYLVHNNRSFYPQWGIGDGEGIMHENHTNSKVLDSRVVGNRGNAYVCLWRVEVDGLEIRDNELELGRKHGAITVLGVKRNIKADCPVRRLRIEGNITRGAGDAKTDAISVTATPGENIAIRGNRHVGTVPARLQAPAGATVADNGNFEVLIR